MYAGKQAHEAAERFNPGWLEDEGETAVLEALGARVTPLCRQPGRLVLTPSRLYFQPFNVASSQPTQVFPLDQARWAPGSPPARPGGERGSPRWACTGQRSAPL